MEKIKYYEWNEIAEVEAMDGTKHVVSSKSDWDDFEVQTYAGMVWRYPVIIISRLRID